MLTSEASFGAPLVSWTGILFACAIMFAALIPRTRVWNIAVDSHSGRSLDSSGEVAFLQHINGKAHAARARRRGFAGVLPNDAGFACSLLIPQGLVA
jgi:hypothetical protein